MYEYNIEIAFSDELTHKKSAKWLFFLHIYVTDDGSKIAKNVNEIYLLWFTEIFASVFSTSAQFFFDAKDLIVFGQTL